MERVCGLQGQLVPGWPMGCRGLPHGVSSLRHGLKRTWKLNGPARSKSNSLARGTPHAPTYGPRVPPPRPCTVWILHEVNLAHLPCVLTLGYLLVPCDTFKLQALFHICRSKESMVGQQGEQKFQIPTKKKREVYLY